MGGKGGGEGGGGGGSGVYSSASAEEPALLQAMRKSLNDPPGTLFAMQSVDAPAAFNDVQTLVPAPTPTVDDTPATPATPAAPTGPQPGPGGQTFDPGSGINQPGAGGNTTSQTGGVADALGGSVMKPPSYWVGGLDTYRNAASGRSRGRMQTTQT